MMLLGTRMVSNGRAAREIFEEIQPSPARAKFGFGEKLAIVNVDVHQAYTRLDLLKAASETNLRQIKHINTISRLARGAGMPVIWSRVAYKGDAADRLQDNRYGSERHAFDPRCEIDPSDLEYARRMPSAFFETPLSGYLRWHKVDTVVVTGGITSGCVRATAVDALSYGFRTIVPIETTADKHESYHYANLTDLLIKYADVEPVQAVTDWLEARQK